MILMIYDINDEMMVGWWWDDDSINDDLVGVFFDFPYVGNNHPNWLTFFRGVEATNQWFMYDSNYDYFLQWWWLLIMLVVNDYYVYYTLWLAIIIIVRYDYYCWCLWVLLWFIMMHVLMFMIWRFPKNGDIPNHPSHGWTL